MFPFLNREFISSVFYSDLELQVFVPRLVTALGSRLKMRYAPFFKVWKDCRIVQFKKKKIKEVLWKTVV